MWCLVQAHQAQLQEMADSTNAQVAAWQEQRFQGECSAVAALHQLASQAVMDAKTLPHTLRLEVGLLALLNGLAVPTLLQTWMVASMRPPQWVPAVGHRQSVCRTCTLWVRLLPVQDCCLLAGVISHLSLHAIALPPTKSPEAELCRPLRKWGRWAEGGPLHSLRQALQGHNQHHIQE